YRVAGVGTNLEMLRFVVGHPELVAGRAHTGFLAEHWHPQEVAPVVPRAAFVAAVAAELVASGLVDARGPRAGVSVDVWQALGPWRIGGSGLPFRYLHAGRPLAARAERGAEPGRWRIASEG